MSRAEVEQTNKALRSRLPADGWFTGRGEYRIDEDRTLTSGAARGLERNVWMKSDLALDISTRRMDDPASGKNEKTAGKWIQFIDLWQKIYYPSIERYVFAPPRTN